MAIVDLVNVNQHAYVFDFDEIACMMIAEAWRLLDKYPHLKMNNESLVECIEFLINESEENMEQKLGWTTPSFEVYSSIKDYPMSDIFEDLVDELVEEFLVKFLDYGWTIRMSEIWYCILLIM